MRKKCERCGRELKFFEQALKSENEKLGLSFTNICGDCHRTVSAAVRGAEKLSAEIENNIEKVYGVNAAEAEPDQLVLLAADALFRLVPDWHNPNSPIASILVMQESVLPNKKEYLDILIYKILRIDFTGALGRYGIDSLDAFLLYMAKFSRYFEQIGANCGERGRKRYSDLFVTRAGLVCLGGGTEVSVVPLHRDDLFGCEEDDTGVTYDITLKSLLWPGTHRRIRFFFTREENEHKLAEFLNEADAVKEARVRKKTDLLLEKINMQAERDITVFVPGKNIGEIEIDHVLLGLMRALLEQDNSTMFDGKEPEGLLKLLIDRYYTPNLHRSGYADYEALQQHIGRECLLSDGLVVSDSGGPESSAWGLFTPHGYIISRYTVPVPFVAVSDSAVNDLYANTRDIVLNGKKMFFIDYDGIDTGIGTLKGVTIRTEKPGMIRKVKTYFDNQARLYLEEENDKLIAQEQKDARISRAAQASAEQFFVDFGLLPFCLRNERLRIETLLRSSDLLLSETIPEPAQAPDGTSTRAGKIAHEFRKAADALAQELGTAVVSPARVLLWKELEKCVNREAVTEWKRLGGDIVNGHTDNLISAVEKYADISEIDTGSAYTLGLFTAYLMDKGIFRDLSFVQAYDSAVQAYRAVCPEASEPVVPAEAEPAASFDTGESPDSLEKNAGPETAEASDAADADTESGGEEQPEPENSKDESDSKRKSADTTDTNTFLFSIRRNKEDRDEIDGIIDALNKGRQKDSGGAGQEPTETDASADNTAGENRDEPDVMSEDKPD